METRTAVVCLGATFVIGVLYGAIAYRTKYPPHGLITYALSTYREYDPSKSQHYRERHSYFETFAQPADVVMLGDSLTEGGDWSRLLPGVSVANHGVNGDGIAGVAKRLAAIEALHPKAVFILAGTNDLASLQPVETVAETYRLIVSRLRRSSAVFVQSTLFTRDAQRNRCIADLNSALATMCDDVGCTFVDLNPTMAPEGVMSRQNSIDGVHLTGPGYKVWSEKIVPLVTAYRKPD